MNHLIDWESLKRDYESGKSTRKDLSKRYQVSYQYLCKVIRDNRWTQSQRTHIPLESPQIVQIERETREQTDSTGTCGDAEKALQLLLQRILHLLPNATANELSNLANALHKYFSISLDSLDNIEELLDSDREWTID